MRIGENNFLQEPSETAKMASSSGLGRELDDHHSRRDAHGIPFNAASVPVFGQ